MGTESNLIFRENRAFYKKLGLALSAIPSLTYIYIFGVGGIKYVKKYGDSYLSQESAVYLPENYLAIMTAIIAVPIIVLFGLGVFLATRFVQEQFKQLENGQAINSKTLSKGFRKNYTRSHLIYVLFSIVLTAIFVIWVRDLTPELAAPLPNGPGEGSRVLKDIRAMGIWMGINCIVWLIITLPLAYFSAFILLLTSFKPETN